MRRTPLGAVALCLALAGCGSNDLQAVSPAASPSPAAPGSPGSDPTADPAESSATAEAPEEPEEPEGGETPDDTSSTDTYASFSPTTGAELPGTTSVINAPAEWDIEPSLGKFTATTLNPLDPQSNVSLTDTDPVFPSTLGEQVGSTRKFGSFESSARRLDDVVIAGIPAYHYAGNASLFDNYVDEFGFELDGRAIKIQVSTRRDEKPARREQLVGTVLASFRLTN